MKRECLILVDLQNDFLSGGALAVPNGNEVVQVANRRMDDYACVIATQDWHPATHRSFASQHVGLAVGEEFLLGGLPQVAWPDHCIRGTWGAALAPRLRVDRIQRLITKGEHPQIDSYSAFFDNGRQQSTQLDAYLQSRSIRSFDVIGLATDYCVMATVLDGRHLGYDVSVIAQGCRGVDRNPGDSNRALDRMRHAGAMIV